eukprot:11185262-Lingulodinium_polyedra.AAC.1
MLPQRGFRTRSQFNVNSRAVEVVPAAMDVNTFQRVRRETCANVAPHSDAHTAYCVRVAFATNVRRLTMKF